MSVPPEAVFAALGDRTRLELLRQLAAGKARSISALASGSRLSRQAITKHLRVLETARLVRRHRRGRETLLALAPAAIYEAQGHLERVAAQWDEALVRLQAFVEKEA